MAGRIWLDITGIRPGGDAALFAVSLGKAIEAIDGVTLVLCRRDPGMVRLDWSALAPGRGRLKGRLGRLPAMQGLISLARQLPDRGRAALGRYVRLQRAAWFAWRRALQLLLQRVLTRAPKDRASPDAGDILLMLTPSGDAARFAQRGVRLVFLAVDPTALLRPDWMEADAAAAAAIWLRTTLPHVPRVIACSVAGALAMRQAGSLPEPIVIPAAPCLEPSAPVSPSVPFVLAAGPLGEAGHTRQLLLAWRSLIDTPPPQGVPVLVLAGAVGALVGDVLEQLRNSRLLQGHVRLVANPSPQQVRSLLDTCRFCIAPSAISGWGRPSWDSRAAGVPCLSGFDMEGTQTIVANDAAAIARSVRAWLADPPPRPAPPRRAWADVARELLAAIVP